MLRSNNTEMCPLILICIWTIAINAQEYNQESTSNVWMNNKWSVFIFIPLYMLIILAFVEACRRFHVLQLLLFGVMPFVLGLRVIEEWDNHRNIWFDIIKMINLIIFTWIIYIIRHLISFHSRGCLSFWSTMLYLSLIFNLIDSTLAEFYVASNRSHMFPGNGIFGICLMLTLGNAKNMAISHDGNCSLEWRVSTPWIYFYTIWEIFFSFNVFCYERIAIIPLHLFVPLIVVIYTNWRQWVQHRVFALTIVYWVQVAPILKYEIPFWLIPDGQCNLVEENMISWKSAFNVISFLLGIALIIRDIIEEYEYWHGHKKTHDTSVIQWIMRCFCCKPNDDIDLLISDEEKQELSVIEEEEEEDELEMASLSPL